MLYVIIGGSSRLGMTVCRNLSDAGHKVVSTYSGRVPAVAIVSVESIECNVLNESSCSKLADRVFSLSQEVTLVYMPAYSVNSMCHKMNKSDWDNVLNVTLGGAFSISSCFLKKMREASFGRIIFIGSLSGRMGVPGTCAYSAAKEGLKGLSKVISNEGASKNITANYLELGYMSAGLTFTIPSKVRAEIESSIPVREFGNPSEVTEAILFLSKANYVNGSILSITGGL